MNPSNTASDATTIAGNVVLDQVIPARGSWSGIVTKGQVLRLIDLEGQQAIDFLCFNADDAQERYHAPNTIKIPRNIFLGKGSILRSSMANPMMTITEDTCGNHDTIFGCCSFEVDDVRYGKHNAKCCQQNFETELARHGLGKEHVVPNANFFMFVPVSQDGFAEIVDSPSTPGDFVDLRADMNVLAALSNCPEELNPAAGSGPTPIQVIVYEPT